MADTLTRTHPLYSHELDFAVLSAELDGLTIEVDDFCSAVDVRIDPDGPGLDAVGRVLGSALPTVANTWTHKHTGQLIWLGPDEWLVTCTKMTAPELTEALDWVVSAYDGAAVDVSAQRTSISLRGPLARELLSFGCALDLRATALPPGSCAQTMIGQTGVLLLALPRGDFRLYVRPSFAHYLADWLLDAATELRS